MAAPDVEDDKPSLLFLLVIRPPSSCARSGMFLTIVLPIAGIAAGLTWALDRNPLFADWRGHWGWDFPVPADLRDAARPLDQGSLVDGATDCDESTISAADRARASWASSRALFPWPSPSVMPLVSAGVICAHSPPCLPSRAAVLLGAAPLDYVQALGSGRSVGVRP